MTTITLTPESAQQMISQLEEAALGMRKLSDAIMQAAEQDFGTSGIRGVGDWNPKVDEKLNRLRDVALFKANQFSQDALELEKDLQRLKEITEEFTRGVRETTEGAGAALAGVEVS